MTARKPPGKLERHPHGLYALQGALQRVEKGEDWTESLGPVGKALRAWKGDLIQALGGDDVVSPQQRALVELATRSHLVLESVDRYILGMPCLVNKSTDHLVAGGRRCLSRTGDEADHHQDDPSTTREGGITRREEGEDRANLPKGSRSWRRRPPAGARRVTVLKSAKS